MSDGLPTTDTLLINVSPGETRIAELADGRLRSLTVRRPDRESLIGNVYLGRVESVVPSVNAAFVDIGLPNSAFLAAQDAREGNARDPVPIAECVHEGETVAVQVVKDPIGGKGPKVRRRLSLPSRFLVLAAGGSNVSVSRRITDEDERERLTQLVREEGGPGNGYIVRTVAAGVDRETLAADVRYLTETWAGIEGARDDAEAPALLFADLDPVCRNLRDRMTEACRRVLIDDRAAHGRALDFCQRFMPDLVERIQLYTGNAGLFEEHEVEQAIDDALQPVVNLPSGGNLVIEQTEALTAIDVNTARAAGRSGGADAALRTNQEAAAEVAWQLRLRGIGGIVVVDFIGIEAADQRAKLIEALETAFVADPEPVQVVGLSDIGLVQITRKRSGDSLAHELTEHCPVCEGHGRLKTAQTVALEILRGIILHPPTRPDVEASVIADPDVIALFDNQLQNAFRDAERRAAAPIELVPDPGCHREYYELSW